MGFFARIVGLGSSPADLLKAGKGSPNRYQVKWYEGQTVHELATFGNWDAAVEAARRKARELEMLIDTKVEITDYADVRTKKLEFFGGSMRTWQSYVVDADGSCRKS